MIKHVKFSYSSIRSRILPCTPAWDYKFHALAVNLQATFKAPFQVLQPFQSEAHFETSQKSAAELFFAEIVEFFILDCRLFLKRAPGCFTGFWTRLCPITYYSSQKVWGEAFHVNWLLTLIDKAFDMNWLCIL